MKVKEIVSRVRSAIDELMKNDSDFLMESEDEKNLTKVIIDKIGYALQYVIENAPQEKLDSNVFETLTTEELQGFSVDSTTLIAKLKLPTDLLRIIEARLSSWYHFPKPLPDTSQVALMQQDEYARGSWDRPVNILTYIGSDRYLEMYCAKTSADTLNFTFIRKPEVEQYDEDDMEEEVGVPTLLESSLIYQIAGMVMTAFSDDIAATLFAIAQKYLETDELNKELRG